MYKTTAFSLILSLSIVSTISASEKPCTELSKIFIEKLKTGKDVSEEIETFANVSFEDLHKELDNDRIKKAFWINIYNGFIQVFLNKNPELYEDRGTFFKAKKITIAGELLSFECIEHGIIRSTKSPIGLGLLPMWFPGKFIRKMKTKKADPRVHCALNCGAKSCPPVAALDYQRLEEQLDQLSKLFMNKFSKYDAENNVVAVPALLQWFSFDWGGKRAKRKFLKKYEVIPKDSKPMIKYLTYDWTLFLDNYVEI